MMVILLMALEFVHILHPPCFFGINTVGTTHGLKLSLTKPLSNNSWTWSFTSSFSRGVNLYASLFHKLAPGIKSI
jgi:zinc transporter ZupT